MAITDSIGQYASVYPRVSFANKPSALEMQLNAQTAPSSLSHKRVPPLQNIPRQEGFRLSANSAASRQPRFGWGDRQHRQVVDQVSQIVRLTQDKEHDPESGLAEFMRDWQPQIDSRSASLDKQSPEPNGFSHFLNVETRGERYKVNGKLYEPADVRSPFAQISLDEMRRLWDAEFPSLNVYRSFDEILSYKTDAKGWSGNVINSIYERYQDLAGLFQESNPRRTQSMSEAERHELALGIAHAMADITHYAADLTQPLHASTFSNHRLAAPFTETRLDGSRVCSEKFQTMHSFMEFSDAILERLSPTSAKALDRPVVQDEVPELLMQALGKTYPRVGEILQADEDVRLAESRRSYEHRLGFALQRLVNEQLELASVLCAELIWSAYNAGGAPDLRPLITDSKPKQHTSARRPFDSIA